MYLVQGMFAEESDECLGCTGFGIQQRPVWPPLMSMMVTHLCSQEQSSESYCFKRQTDQTIELLYGIPASFQARSGRQLLS